MTKTTKQTMLEHNKLMQNFGEEQTQCLNAFLSSLIITDDEDAVEEEAADYGVEGEEVETEGDDADQYDEDGNYIGEEDVEAEVAEDDADQYDEDGNYIGDEGEEEPAEYDGEEAEAEVDDTDQYDEDGNYIGDDGDGDYEEPEPEPEPTPVRRPRQPAAATTTTRRPAAAPSRNPRQQVTASAPQSRRPAAAPAATPAPKRPAAPPAAQAAVNYDHQTTDALKELAEKYELDVKTYANEKRQRAVLIDALKGLDAFAKPHMKKDLSQVEKMAQKARVPLSYGQGRKTEEYKKKLLLSRIMQNAG